jgi:spoIIIJ-associated protein
MLSEPNFLLLEAINKSIKGIMDVTTYLSHITQHCGLDEDSVQITIDETDDTVSVQLDVPADDVGLFIGNRGETLAALQRMLRIVFNDQYGEKHIVLNINDYRQERQKQLEERAMEAARYVLDSGRPYTFPFLSSYERFLVHSVLSNQAEFASLETMSEGEGRDRRLVVRPKAA